MYFRNFCSVLALAVLSGSSSVTASGKSYSHTDLLTIVAGRTAQTLEFPYQAALERRERSICGGSIIGDRFVLTAAHCVKSIEDLKPVPNKVMVVRVGHDIAATDGTIYEIEKVQPHPKYDDTAIVDQFDIALVKLAKPFVFGDRVKPIELVTEAPKEGQIGVVTGYGKQHTQRSHKRHLMAVKLPIVGLESCRKILHQVADDMLCAGWKKGHRDSCQGDSGGPLAVDEKLAGVVAWGIGCGREGFPGVYTNVAHYRKWVEDTMKDM